MATKTRVRNKSLLLTYFYKDTLNVPNAISPTKYKTINYSNYLECYTEGKLHVI